MHISIITGVRKSNISGEKMVIFCKKDVLLKLNFQAEGHLDTYVLIYILTIYRECVLFQLFNHGIRMHIPILTGVQKRHISGLKK